MEDVVADRTFWSGRRVFITGHTGFKGSWLSIWLHALGAQLYGYALKAPTEPSLYDCARVGRLFASSTTGDVRDLESLQTSVQAARPEIVFHLAAQPLVHTSYRLPVDTFSTNVMGTVHLLEALRSVPSVRAVVNVTTDKVYENREWIWGYRENDGLGGFDPYSSSKSCSELVTAAYRNSFFHEKSYGSHHVAVATARSGNVIGGGDWAADRLFPDCIRAFTRGEVAKIRNPGAIRPWQHVLDPLNGYLALARSLFQEGPLFSGSWNFAPDADNTRTVSWVVQETARLWGGGAAFAVETGDHPHETSTLVLDSSKARRLLGWSPRWDGAESVQKAVDWFQQYLGSRDAHEICREQIETFEASR